MNKRRYPARRAMPWHVAGCVAAVVLLVAGCTSSPADGTTASSDSVSSSAPTPSVVDVSPDRSSSVPSSVVSSSAGSSSNSTQTSGTVGPEAQEAADRAAVEAQWKKFWDVYENIIRTPAVGRKAALEAVATDPIKARILDAAGKSEAQGVDYYGSVVQHPYWIQPVGGNDFALMRDCQDQSKYGSIDVASGNKRTVGVARDSLQAGFIRDSNGVWRVQNIQYLEDVPC